LQDEAQKFIRKLSESDRSILDRLLRSLHSLQENPFQGKPLRHEFKGRYSLRVGVYRIIYRVDQKIVTVFIIDIAHRKNVYN